MTKGGSRLRSKASYYWPWPLRKSIKRWEIVPGVKHAAMESRCRLNNCDAKRVVAHLDPQLLVPHCAGRVTYIAGYITSESRKRRQSRYVISDAVGPSGPYHGLIMQILTT